MLGVVGAFAGAKVCSLPVARGLPGWGLRRS
jgi:hypothetical protein